MKYYVTCTDKFLSGWGMAENKISKFVIECDSYADAEICKRNMEKEPVFKYVRIRTSYPKYDERRYHTSVKSFSECYAYNH